MTTEPILPLDEKDVKWVVNDLGELGVCVKGRCFFLYKGESLDYMKWTEKGEKEIMVRPVGKREFGEVCKPISQMRVVGGKICDMTPSPYNQELTYTPGMSDGKPWDCDWKPLSEYCGVKNDD